MSKALHGGVISKVEVPPLSGEEALLAKLTEAVLLSHYKSNWTFLASSC